MGDNKNVVQSSYFFRHDSYAKLLAATKLPVFCCVQESKWLSYRYLLTYLGSNLQWSVYLWNFKNTFQCIQNNAHLKCNFGLNAVSIRSLTTKMLFLYDYETLFNSVSFKLVFILCICKLNYINFSKKN